VVSRLMQFSWEYLPGFMSIGTHDGGEISAIISYF
jgi:hypothetical protein